MEKSPTHPTLPGQVPPQTSADTELTLTFFIKHIDQWRNEQNKTVAYRRCSYRENVLKDK